MTDKLDRLRAAASEARDLDLRLRDLEAEVADVKSRLTNLHRDKLPELLDDAGLDRIGVPAAGNKPAIDFVLRPYFSAAIAASWPEARRGLAFAWLREHRAGDLIKTEVTARFPKGSEAEARAAAAALEASAGVPVEVKTSVHSQTLTAWLREIYERRHQALSTEDLETIGASVGRVVKIDERRE